MGRIADNFRDKARHAAEEASKAHSDDEGAMQRNREAGFHQLADNEEWLDGRRMQLGQSALGRWGRSDDD